MADPARRPRTGGAHPADRLRRDRDRRSRTRGWAWSPSPTPGSPVTSVRPRSSTPSSAIRRRSPTRQGARQRHRRAPLDRGQADRHQVRATLEFVADIVPDTASELDEAIERVRHADAELARAREGAGYAGDPDPYRRPAVDEDEDDGGPSGAAAADEESDEVSTLPRSAS